MCVGGGTNPRHPGGKRTERDLTNGPSTTIATTNGNQTPVVAVTSGWRNRLNANQDAPSRTVAAKGNTALAIAEGWHHPADPFRGPSYERGKGRAATRPDLLDRPSVTVTTTDEKGTRASASSGFDFNGGPDRVSDVLFLAIGRRRATPWECARLQGFPDGHFSWAGTTKRSLYRQVGNAVPPVLAERVLLGVLGFPKGRPR
jgi:site-specific DNA-cytosine methylase